MLLEALLLVTGLVVLYFGAEWLVAGASKLALAFGISPLIIGLTIVAAATSAPEFVVSLMAALNGSPDIALGNVVGSNVANIALIVGAASVVLPMAVERSVLVRDYPFLLVSVVLMLGTAYTGGMINRPEGAVLVMLTLVFLAVCGRKAIAESRSYRATSARDPEATRASRLALHVVKIVVGLAGLVIGARLMVDNAVTIARFYGIPELVIGVTVVALGTSLPELATSLVAAFKKEADISLGNIIGSNIFNSGLILGGVGIVAPIDVSPEALRFDLPAMAFVSLLLFPLMRMHRKISRADGAILLTAYIGYIAFSVLFSTGRL
jgi:cation:H+ antiporter